MRSVAPTLPYPRILYRIEFTLPIPLTTDTVMYLEVQAGNFGTVYLNDFETPIIPEFQRWLPTGHSPTSSGLKAGDNELRILVRDTGGPAGFQYHMKVTQETAQS